MFRKQFDPFRTVQFTLSKENIMAETLRTKSTNAILVAVRNSDLGPLQRLKVRLALLDSDKREEIEEFIFMKGQEQATIAAEVTIEAVNWDAIIAFIEKLLPLILKIIAMFPK